MNQSTLRHQLLYKTWFYKFSTICQQKQLLNPESELSTVVGAFKKQSLVEM